MRSGGMRKAVGVGASVLAAVVVAGCGGGSAGGGSVFGPDDKGSGSASPSAEPDNSSPAPKDPYLSQAELEDAILTAADLGPGWTRMPVQTSAGTSKTQPTAADAALRANCPPYREQDNASSSPAARYLSASFTAPKNADVPYLDYELTITVQQSSVADLSKAVEYGRRSGVECKNMPVAEPGNPYTLDYSALKNLPPYGDEAAGLYETAQNATGLNATSWLLVRLGNTLVEISGSPNAVEAFMSPAVLKVKRALDAKN